MVKQENFKVTITDEYITSTVLGEEIIGVTVAEGFNMVVGNNFAVIDCVYVCGENLSGHRVVYIKDNMAYYADNTLPDSIGKVIGLTTQASTIGQTVIIRKIGVIENTGWGLTPNATYYLGTNGAISTTIGNGIYSQAIGFAVDSDNLEINIYNPTLR